MQKEMISAKQAICILVLFVFGNTLVLGVNFNVEQDAWISSLITVATAIPVVLIYGRIVKLFPDNDLYDIMEKLFGKIGSKIFIVLVTWYSIHLGALVLRSFSEFIETIMMPDTPQLPIMILLLIAIIYLTKSGIESLGKWSLIMLPFTIGIVLFTVIFSIQYMDFSNLFPIMEHDIKSIAVGSYKVFSFPLAETVLFLTILCSVKPGKSPYKIYIWGVLIGSIFLLIVSMRNLFVLGSQTLQSEYFPSYAAARVINIGNFLNRFEGSISVNFILAGITKISVCVFSGAKGLAKLFNIKQYKQLIIPTCLLILAVSLNSFNDIMQMFQFIDIYPIYAVPFQIIIPIIIWITAEFKTRNTKKSIAVG